MLGVLAALNTTTTSTSSTTSYICQVAANGVASAGSNCNALKNYFSPPAYYTSLWQVELGVIVIVCGCLAGVIWKMHPFGRFYWNKKGTKAILHFHGQAGVIGMLFPFLDKIMLFESSGSERKKNKIRRLIPAVPQSATHLRQEDGGDSIILIDGDKGLPVSAELDSWAQANLGELSESHDWNHFALKTKSGLLTRNIAKAKLFPAIQDFDSAPTVYLMDASGDLSSKVGAELTDQEKSWYIHFSSECAQLLKEAEEQQAKTLAILNGDSFYLKGNEKVMLPARKKTEWVNIITDELANLKGTVASALLSFPVSFQYVAAVLSNVPDGLYFDAAKAEVEEKVRKELSKNPGQYLPMVIAVLALLGGIGFLFYVFSHNFGG